ncbi:DUF885 domain-containing protein [Emcibacter nanhaiensis]|uniref:DUF885 domain-containing protein n=1 Tax=Emcibacter nanhaiensis TaxID=1505037 RepID=A0A501PNP3_9PROT|nr:DUF885 domain-containing protein [Emcibacter nanhaiensis]TPD61788.1 DUF885 domain-containing protein [Emcibacter nanhaiensis]
MKLKTAFSVVLLAGALALPVQADETKGFRKILDDSWEYAMKEFPTYASYLGDKRYNDQLDHASLKDEERRAEHTKKILARLDKIQLSKLSAEDQLNYKLFRTEVERDIEAHTFKNYLFNITNRGGWHMDFAQLPSLLSFTKEKDYRDFISRLNAYPRFNAENMEVMKEAIREGFVHACASMEGYETSISTHIVKDVEKSALYAPFVKMPDMIPADTQAELRAEAKKAIMDKVVPAYQALYELYTEDYQPHCMKQVGALHWPNGKAYYEHRVRQYTTTDMTPQEVHEKGLSEVKRIRGEMMDVIKEVGFDGGLQEFIEFLRTDPQFYAKTPEELLGKASTIAKKMDGQLPKLFGHLPRQPYGIAVIPADIAEKTTTAYYMPGAPDGSRAGFYYVNTSLLDSRPLYTLESLTLHEAVPGHHLQIALASETDLPNFRRYGGYTVFVEGWGLYAERLGLEVGFYEDPYSNFGRLSYEMWRALRLVVDTGMHYLGWTRQQAIDFMAENSALSLHNITAEVDRYITWPGQALAYKTGELKIRELRARAEEALGEDFDLRAFHDEILRHGAVPISVLEDIVDNWIKTRKS